MLCGASTGATITRLQVTTSACSAALVAAATCFFIVLPSTAHSQTSTGPIVTGFVAAAAANGGAKVSVAGSVGYRFNRVFGMGMELVWADLKYAPASETFESPFESTTISYINPSLDALFFTTNFRVEIPTRLRRVLPYATGGGGVASTTARYTLAFTSSVPGRPTMTQTEPRSVEISTSLALTGGGGVSVLITNHLSVDIDGRMLYGRGNGFIGRFGVGTSYRF